MLALSRLSSSSRPALEVFFKTSTESKLVSVSESNLRGLSEQEVYARLAYNRLYVSSSVTDSLDGEFYKHQHLVGRQMFLNDSALIIHDPGTGKTMTYLYVMMELIKAGAITKFLIINYSNAGNKVAERTLRAMYDRRYIHHFQKTFNQFWTTHVKTTTLHNLGKYRYESHMGIVIDEAHNMLSDNEPGTNKVANVEKFIGKLSLLRGVKLMLLTATPLQGEAASLGKFRSILLRNGGSDSRSCQTIPPSLVSYTQINYSHLQVKEILNDSNTLARQRGNRSFELTNGMIYPFFLYCQKPSSAQIADFAALAVSGKQAPFQSDEKPLIVSSLPREHLIETHSNSIKVEMAQSAIVESIIHLVEKTTDGTIIVYCDLVEDGSKAVSRYLDQNGWQRYTTQSSRNDNPSFGRSSTGQSRNQYNSQIKQLETELSEKSLRLRDLTSQLHKTSQDEVDALREQIELRSQPAVGNPHELDSFAGYASVRRGLIAYLEHYQQQHDHYRETLLATTQLTTECEQLRDRIATLKSLRTETRAVGSGMKYMIYSSSMSAKDNDAFRLFNSEANWNGKLIKMIIGSKVMRDGVDIFHAVQTHIIIPEWRISGFIQAQHRGIRSSGHNHLIHHRAIRLVEEQHNDINIPLNQKMSYEQAREKIISEKVTIEIYNHFVDMELLTLDDIVQARAFINGDMKRVFNDKDKEKAKRKSEAFTEYDRILKQLSDEEILKLLKSDGTSSSDSRELLHNTRYKAGEAIINAAVEKYREVGSEMTRLRSSALDYKLNVKRDGRLKNAITPDERLLQAKTYQEQDFLGTEDMELFFSEDYTEAIIKQIANILLEKCYAYTDDIFGRLTSSQVDVKPNHRMIATAIVELVQYRKKVYSDRLGIWLYVKLWEKFTAGEEESIIYLTTTDIPSSNHPFNVISPTIGYSASSHIRRTLTKITKEDLAIPKSIKTFYKLKDLIEKAMTSGTSGEITQVELTFLLQMSNYWAFSWKELMQSTRSCCGQVLGSCRCDVKTSPELAQTDSFDGKELMQSTRVSSTKEKDPLKAVFEQNEMNVYVFKDHIIKPSMNNLAKALSIFEYKVATREWKATTVVSLKDVVLVRYATLVDFYRRFNFFQLPEFSNRATRLFTETQKNINGIIFIKGYYNLKDKVTDTRQPQAAARNESRHELDDWLNRLLLGEDVLCAPVVKNVLVKEFMSSTSRGGQIVHTMPEKYGDKTQVLAKIKQIVEQDITLLFFLYDKDTSVRGSAFSIFDIKREEMRVMLQAVNGTPTPRFQIYAIESTIVDPQRKKEIYRRIYELPTHLARAEHSHEPGLHQHLARAEHSHEPGLHQHLA